MRKTHISRLAGKIHIQERILVNTVQRCLRCNWSLKQNGICCISCFCQHLIHCRVDKKERYRLAETTPFKVALLQYATDLMWLLGSDCCAIPILVRRADADSRLHHPRSLLSSPGPMSVLSSTSSWKPWNPEILSSTFGMNPHSQELQTGLWSSARPNSGRTLLSSPQCFRSFLERKYLEASQTNTDRVSRGPKPVPGSHGAGAIRYAGDLVYHTPTAADPAHSHLPHHDLVARRISCAKTTDLRQNLRTAD